MSAGEGKINRKTWKVKAKKLTANEYQKLMREKMMF